MSNTRPLPSFMFTAVLPAPSFIDRVKGAVQGFKIGCDGLQVVHGQQAPRPPLAASAAKNALDEAIDAVGSQAALAKRIGVTQQAISYWVKNGGRVPAEYVRHVERASGVPRHRLRPDMFGSAVVGAA